MAGSSYDSDSDDSLDDDSFIDLYSHVEQSSRRLIRRQSREPDPVSDSPQGLERRSSRRLLGPHSPSVEKGNRQSQFQSQSQPLPQPQRRVSSSSHDGEMPKSRSPTSRRRTSSTDQPSGMLGSFLANEQSKSTSSTPKGSRSICSAPALVRRKSGDSVDCGASVGSRKTVSHHTQQRPSGESSSRSSRSVSQSRSVSRSRQNSSRNLHGSSRQDSSARGERSSRPDASSRGERSSGRSDPKDAESMVASKLREIRKGQDEQRRKSQELKRSMSQRHAYRSARSTSVSRSSRNLTRQNSSDSLSYGNTSTRSSSSARTSSSSPKPTRSSSYLDNLFAPGTQ